MTEKLVYTTLSALTALPLIMWMQPPWYVSFALMFLVFQMYGLTYSLNVLVKSQGLIMFLLSEEKMARLKQTKDTK